MTAQMNFIVGDSIPRGFGSSGLTGGGFADEVTGDKWFWPDASVERTLNDLMIANGIRDRFVYLIYSGYSGSPVNATNAVSSLTALINDGTVKPGHRIVITDDGAIPDDADAYYALWADLISLAHAAGVSVKALTTKDVSGADWQSRGYGLPPANSRFDRTLTAGSPQRTGNQCIRDAMTASGLTAHECGADMLSAAISMYGQTTIRIIQDDWIHPNMWGQWRWCRNILVACGLASSVTNINPVRDRVSANWQALQYNAPSNFWTQANALKAVDFCLKNVAFP